VKLATKLNVLETMKKMITCSDVIRDGVKESEVQVHGAVYNLFSGKVEWLGQHPDVEKLCEAPMPMHMWKVRPYISGMQKVEGRGKALAAIEALRQGNQRFCAGESTKYAPLKQLPQNPSTVLVGGGEVRLPLERIFDVQDGSIVSQKILGGYHNSANHIDTPTASIEFAIARYEPKLLVVVGKSGSKLADKALEMMAGTEAPSHSQQGVLSDLLVSALRATQQAEREEILTAAGRDRIIKKLTIELNLLYTIEQLLVSKEAVRESLEIHAAVLSSRTGLVEFIGEHPMLDEIVRTYESRERLVCSWADPLSYSSYADPLSFRP